MDITSDRRSWMTVFHGPAESIAPCRAAGHRRLVNRQFLETAGFLFFQITQAAGYISTTIHHQDMPALLVDGEPVPAIHVYFIGPDCAIAQIDRAAKPLHCG